MAVREPPLQETSGEAGCRFRNPGPEYRNSRHNLGFMALDGLVKDLLLEFKLDKESRSMRTTTFLIKKMLSYASLLPI